MIHRKKINAVDGVTLCIILSYTYRGVLECILLTNFVNRTVHLFIITLV